jgi:hypothetical protein
MTMVSFRVDEAEVERLREWTSVSASTGRSSSGKRCGGTSCVSPASRTPRVWEARPLEEGERSLAEIDDWGPAEDWSDWADATR